MRIEYDILRETGFDKTIKYFARVKSRKVSGRQIFVLYYILVMIDHD